jgi:hypothetical protein
MKTALIVGVAFVLGAVAVTFGPNAKLGWDPVEVDVDGNPETVVSAEVAISDVGIDLRTGGVALKVVGNVSPNGTGVALSALQINLPRKQYALWVRVQVEAGNWSQWSEPLVATYDSVPPMAPGGCRLVK